MLEIVSTDIIESGIEPSGRRLIRELHTDSTGAVHQYSYYAGEDTGVDSIATERAAVLPNQILHTYEDREAANGVFSG